MPIQKNCLVCGKGFSAAPSRSTYDRGKYCSVTCRGLARRAKPIKRECRQCGQKFDIIPRLLKISKGWYCSHPCFINSTRGKEKMSFVGKLISRIKFPTNEKDCAIWTGSPDHQGYGKTSRMIDGKQVTIRPHRAVYELYFGSVDPSMGVLHKCDNPLCCNILHLFAGSQLDNIRDKVAKGRQARGEKNNHAKLTSKQVIKIKRLIKKGLYLVDIATRYKVTTTAISEIKAGRTWKHIFI